MAQGFVHERTTDYSNLKSRLMGGSSRRQRAEHFDVLNRQLRPGLVATGQWVIVPDPYSVICSVEAAWLMRYAEQIQCKLEASVGSFVRL
jgi:hypothetical protein